MKNVAPPNQVDQLFENVLALADADAAVAEADVGGGGGGQTVPIPWIELREYALPRASADIFIHDDLGKNPTGHQIIAVIQQHTGAPDELFEPAVLRSELLAHVTGFMPAASDDDENETDASAAPFSAVWKCVTDRVGFWAAILAFGLIVALFVAITAAIAASGGVLGAVFWAAFWAAFGEVAGYVGWLTWMAIVFRCLIP